MKRNNTPSIKDIVSFGWNDDSKYLWIVLDIRDDTALIISEKAVRVSTYHDQLGQVSWEQSAVRCWLNGDFYSCSLTEKEKKAVVDIQFVENGDTDDIMDTNTFDHFFLLNREEVERYFPKADERTLTLSFEDTAGMWLGSNGVRTTCCWWLRSDSSQITGSPHSYVPVCDMDGLFDHLLSTDSGRAAVRPAAWVKVNELCVVEQESIDRPLYGLLKEPPLSSVSEFSDGRTTETRVLGSFVDYEQGHEYLMLKPDLYDRDEEMPFYQLALEPVRNEYTRKKLETVVRMLREKPRERVVSELWHDFCRHIVDDSMKQPAWVSQTDDSCPELQAGSELIIGHNIKKNTFEPLRWKILVRKGDKALVICQKGLYYDVFASDDDDDEVFFKRDSINIWEYSSLRKWLNGEFYQRAFSMEEQSIIMEYQTEFGDRIGRAWPGDKPIFDYCFLLSDAEATVFFPDDRSRQLMMTENMENAFSRPVSSYHSKEEAWWCRSRGESKGLVVCVSPSGSLDMHGRSADTEMCAVRPAMLINLNELAYRRSLRESVMNGTSEGDWFE